MPQRGAAREGSKTTADSDPSQEVTNVNTIFSLLLCHHGLDSRKQWSLEDVLHAVLCDEIPHALGQVVLLWTEFESVCSSIHIHH